MITNSTLGFSGRLGNQMFQYAMLVGIKYKLGFDVIIREHIHDITPYGIFELANCFHLKECHFFNPKDMSTPYKYEEERFHFDTRFFKKITDGTDFHGYFQSEKYFEHCKDVIKQDFTFRPHIQQQADRFLEPLQGKELISIHCRRGDYVNQPLHHPICSLDYYKSAMKLFSDDVHYIIFSDDIDWCKEHLQLENATYSNNSTSVDICIMSNCHHNIIANSTFSWWGAWLNSNSEKKVIAPNKWFGPAYSHYDTKDLYISDWITL